MLDGQGEMLKPYVPRLLIEWVRSSRRRALPRGRRLARIRRHLRLHRAHGASRAPREDRRRAVARHARRRLQGAARRGVQLGRRTVQVGRRRAAPALRGPGHEAAGSPCDLGDAANDRAGRPDPCRRRHRDAPDVDRDHNGDDRLLHSGERAPRAPGRRAGADRDRVDRSGRGRRRDRDQPCARRPARPGVRRPAEGGRRSCSSLRRTSSGSAHRTSAR